MTGPFTFFRRIRTNQVIANWRASLAKAEEEKRLAESGETKPEETKEEAKEEIKS